MSQKISAYIDVLFSGVPRSKKAVELREEVLANMTERFNDYLAEGMSENQAYSLTVANMGDVDEMLRTVTPDEDFKREARYYRLRNARNTAIAVGMYILGAAVLIGCGAFGGDSYAIGGLLGLLVLAAIATGLLIYTSMSTPVEYKDFDEQAEKERRYARDPHARTRDAISTIFWSVMTIVYLTISFLTRAWHISWIIWPLAGIAWGIVETIGELRSHHEP